MPKFEVKEMKATRAGFGEGLVELARRNPNIVGLAADLAESVRMDKFAKEFPERFFTTGVAEQNLIAMAAGLSIAGKIPFAGTFAVFAAGRAYDMVRQDLAYSNLNVKIAASHSGLTLGEDGATHQILEDIGMMRCLPNMTVLVPCDANETKNAVFAAAAHWGPVYLRFSRPNLPNFTDEKKPFLIGKSATLVDGKDVTIIACGVLVWQAVLAAEELEIEGVSARVVNMSTLKPLDEEAIVRAARETGAIVTAEEHQRNSGLGDAVAHVVATTHPVPMEIVAVQDTFGESGKPDELLAKYHISKNDILASVKQVLKRKRLT
jgi:transketolase